MTQTDLLRRPARRADTAGRRRAPRARQPELLPLFGADAPAAPATELPATGDGPTLDDLVVGAWEGLLAHETVPCPACGGALAPRYSAGHEPVGGRCAGCGTTIA